MTIHNSLTMTRIMSSKIAVSHLRSLISSVKARSYSLDLTSGRSQASSSPTYSQISNFKSQMLASAFSAAASRIVLSATFRLRFKLEVNTLLSLMLRMVKALLSILSPTVSQHTGLLE